MHAVMTVLGIMLTARLNLLAVLVVSEYRDQDIIQLKICSKIFGTNFYSLACWCQLSIIATSQNARLVYGPKITESADTISSVIMSYLWCGVDQIELMRLNLVDLHTLCYSTVGRQWLTSWRALVTVALQHRLYYHCQHLLTWNPKKHEEILVNVLALWE